MSFINSFNKIIENPTVKSETERLLNLGLNDPLFSSYFGVNYDADNLISVKLYFSFLNQLPGDEVLNEFIKDPDFIKLIKENWRPSIQHNYHHQGITLSLKCYLEGNDIRVNKYVHFRTPHFLLGLPDSVILNKEDLNNAPGFCIEQHGIISELKKYFYITSIENKLKLIEMFDNQDNININDISLIEYTESPAETKINMALNSSDAVNRYLAKTNNLHIIELSLFFFDNLKLYYFSPGVRLNSSVKALYFLPESMYYKLGSVNSLHLLFKKQ